MNEFGVRSNPVCVDNVDTTSFTNITSIDFLDINSVSSAADSALVSLGLNRVYSVYSPSLELPLHYIHVIISLSV